MLTIAQLMERMIAFSKGNIHDIDHFVRVWNYARTIAELEGVDEGTRFVLEVAAIVHDIACPLCREKYGNTNGRHQEAEGAPMAAAFLADSGMTAAQIERVAYLVGHHHTFTEIDSIDYQILIEADYIANATENGWSGDNVRNFVGKYFTTAAGKRLVAEIFREQGTGNREQGTGLAVAAQPEASPVQGEVARSAGGAPISPLCPNLKGANMLTIAPERLTAGAYIDFLKRTDLGSQYPAERFEARIERLVKNVPVSLTAREDGHLVGVLFGITDFAYWLFITDLGVDRDFVGQGIGKRLMAAALEAAGGADDIIVYTCANENAVGFYEKLGMRLADDVMVYNRVQWTDFTVK